MDNRLPQLEALYREGSKCRACFEAGQFGVEVPLTADYAPFDIAQPRWVGPRYWDAPVRVLFVMLNPGEGKKRQRDNAYHLDVLRGFRDGDSSLDDVFRFQLEDMECWGPRGRSFFDFFEQRTGGAFEEIALLNIAWCPTKGDSYPARMLRQCWARHSAGVVKLLEPHAAILCGRDLEKWMSVIKSAGPSCDVLMSLHPATRKGRADRARDAQSIQSRITQLRSERVQ